MFRREPGPGLPTKSACGVQQLRTVAHEAPVHPTTDGETTCWAEGGTRRRAHRPALARGRPKKRFGPAPLDPGYVVLRCGGRYGDGRRAWISRVSASIFSVKTLSSWVRAVFVSIS